MPPRARRAVHAVPRLLSASEGHVLRGRRPPQVLPEAVERFPGLVAESFRWSLESRKECGFLAYLDERGDELHPEPLSYGREVDIAWHWRHPNAVVAFSLHSHPTDDAACMPSGIDLLGAMVRGDHVHYVLTLDGRLTGWRFRGTRHEARAIHDALKSLSDVGKLRRPFVNYLHRAFSATAPGLVEPVYGARVRLHGDDLRFHRCDPLRLLEAERWSASKGV